MVLDLISVRQATERNGHSCFNTGDLSGNGGRDKIAGVWLVDPLSVEVYHTRTDRLGNTKRGTWASGDEQEEDEAL